MKGPPIDDDEPLSNAEIIAACQDFVARGCLAQAAVDRLLELERCSCGHARTAHTIFYETNLSLCCGELGCECIEFTKAASS